MKKLKPSHREKKRYLLVEGKDADKRNLEEAILKYIGILGYSKASPSIVKKSKNSLILAVNRGSLEEIRASFLLSEKEIKIKKISGSLKKLKQ
jgi:RNase P/RNase MRP subunit POP5